MSPRKTIDWLVINANRGGSLDCLRCGASYLPTYPAPVDVIVAISKALEKTHRTCMANAEGERCPFCLKLGHDHKTCPDADVKTIDAWLRGPDTGIASRAIVDAIVGHGAVYDAPAREMRRDPPSDPADFGRCHRLLTRFPELRPRLGEVAENHPAWAPFVREWDRMTALYEREEPTGSAPELFALMQALAKEGRAT